MDPLLEQFNLSLYRSNVAIYNGEGQDITQYLAGYYINTPQGVVTGLADLGSGDYAGEMTVSGGAMRSSNFKSGTAGWQLKYDGTLNASSVTLTGSITATAGTIGGFTIGATTITGSTLVLDSAGTIKTASSGQRVEINTQTLILYDTGAEVIKFGTASATDGNTTAVKLSLNANTLAGIQIDSATTATLGMRMDSSSNVVFNGLRIALTNTGTSNSGYGIYVENDGGAAGSYCIDVSKATAGKAVRITNTGTGATLSLNQNNASGSPVIETYQNSASYSGDVVYIDNIGTGIGINLLNDTDGANYALKVTHASSGVSSIFIDKNSSGPVIEIDQDVSNAAACYGISMAITNTSTGVEYAFDFQGSEINTASVGGSQDKTIKIRIGATAYYIPCYTTG